MKALEWSQHYPSIFKMLKGANSIISNGILTKFKLVQAYIVVLLICKNKEDPLKIKSTRVVTTNYKSKKWCKDQESIQSSTTPDPGYQWESDKLTEDTTNESQEVSPFPAGDHKAHINRRAQNIANTRQNKNIKDPQKKYRLGTVSKIFYWRA